MRSTASWLTCAPRLVLKLPEACRVLVNQFSPAIPLAIADLEDDAAQLRPVAPAFPPATGYPTPPPPLLDLSNEAPETRLSPVLVLALVTARKLRSAVNGAGSPVCPTVMLKESFTMPKKSPLARGLARLSVLAWLVWGLEVVLVHEDPFSI